MIWLGFVKKSQSFWKSFSESNIMAPLVYTSDEKLGKMETLADTRVHLCKNSATVDGHNSLSRFPNNIIHIFLLPLNTLSSILSSGQQSKTEKKGKWKSQEKVLKIYYIEHHQKKCKEQLNTGWKPMWENTINGHRACWLVKKNCINKTRKIIRNKDLH